MVAISEESSGQGGRSVARVVRSAVATGFILFCILVSEARGQTSGTAMSRAIAEVLISESAYTANLQSLARKATSEGDRGWRGLQRRALRQDPRKFELAFVETLRYAMRREDMIAAFAALLEREFSVPELQELQAVIATPVARKYFALTMDPARMDRVYTGVFRLDDKAMEAIFNSQLHRQFPEMGFDR
ncbi:MAG TPA: hypothetical protein PK170_01230 [Anaerolineae bacterium]|nr:hypothetical protein [Anaerolineae bacterium]